MQLERLARGSFWVWDASVPGNVEQVHRHSASWGSLITLVWDAPSQAPVRTDEELSDGWMIE
jgi:hypothetical protein